MTDEKETEPGQEPEKKKRARPPGFGAPDTPEQTALREQAAKVGLKFRGRPKAETMRALLEEHIAAQNAPKPVQEEISEKVSEEISAEPAPVVQEGERLFLTEEEYRKQNERNAKLDAGRLVRCRITCMNPNKKNWTGQFFSVGSAKIGTFKKMIPFNMEEPYHIPKILYEDLKDRKCAIRNVRKTPDGREHIEVKLINEFAVEVLPNLTDAELEDLKRRQAMARGAV